MTRTAKDWWELPRALCALMKSGFAGYFEDPREYLKRTFSDISQEHDLIVPTHLFGFESHCEHHMTPIIGREVLKFKDSIPGR
jgi:GTP cyclohydrolase IA